MNNSWIEKVILNFFTYSKDTFDETSTYHGFEMKGAIQNSTYGHQSDQLYGKILYKDEAGNIQKLVTIFVKLPSDKAFASSNCILLSFANEINFYTKIVPMMKTWNNSFYARKRKDVMSDSWIEQVILNFFTNNTDIFGKGSKYQGFEPNEETRKLIQTARDGFRSTQLQGWILYKDEQGNIHRSHSIFIKSIPDPAPYEFITFSFSNEINFFTKIAPTMSTLQESFLSLLPKFNHGEIMLNRKHNKAAIIFEDLKALGYKMSEKRSFLDYEHLALMMRKLGEFHAYSYKAKNSIPDSFYPMANMFQEVNTILIYKWYGSLIEEVAHRGLKFLRKNSALAQYTDRLQELMGKNGEIHRQVLTQDGNNPISVITHGDYLRGNLMFRYDKNGVPEDLIMIDMDSYRYASPVVDLALPLYLNADQATRNMYWDKLIDEYYTALENTFPDNKVPSKEQILSDFVGKSFYAYVVASYFLPLMIARDGNIAFSEDVDSDIAKKFFNLDLKEIPIEMWLDLYMQVGGEQGTEALNDILLDMIDRKFICN